MAHGSPRVVGSLRRPVRRALLLVVLSLYVLGLFVQSRLYGMIDWFLMRVPVVTTIYGAMRNLFAALDRQARPPQFKRVVLVEFPQPGMRRWAS